MKKIFRNMIPYWHMILAIVLLLIVQAYCDLSLPQYTSDIIDVGIQNGGIEHILPERITAEEYGRAIMFMTEEELELWESCYEEDGDNYCLIEKTDEELDELDEALLIPIVFTYQIKNMDKTNFENMSEELSNGDLSAGEAVQMMRGKLEETIASAGNATFFAMGAAYARACDVEAGVDVDKIQTAYLWKVGGRMFVLALLMLVAAVLTGFFASKVGAGVGRDLRGKIFGKVVGFSGAEIDHFSTASLITRSTNDIQQIQMVTAIMLRMILYAPIIGIGGIIKVFETGAGMEWIIALAVVLIMGFVFLLVGIAMPKFKAMQKLVDALNLVSREILTGLSVIRAFGREETEEKRFDKANKELTKTQLFTNRVMTFMMPGMMMIMYGVILLIVWVSAHHIDDGSLQVGAMTAFITYAMQIVMAFLMLTMMSIMLPRAGVAADRIDEVLLTKVSVAESKTPKHSGSHRGVLKFSHVNFRYPGANENALTDIDFTAEPGKVTAIIGSTGCGKSTLVNLIPRFYDVTDGKITLDGEDIRDISLEELRKTIGFVPQKGVLFSGTIASNLRFGNKEATDAQIREAAVIAQAADFIEEKHDMYESTIAQGGSNVSGGQKQRLAIARAIVKQPKLFVFDDSFSALDMKTDAALRAALLQKVKDSAVIIVAQRISTILHADEILVLDDGKIVGKGTHDELLNACEVYGQIARSQLSEQELSGTVRKEEDHE